MKSKESIENEVAYLSVKGLDYTCSGRCDFCLSETTSRCLSCLRASYCNKDCQKQHWSQHKYKCGYDAVRVCNNIYAFIGNMQDCEFRRELVKHAKGVYALALRFESLLDIEQWKNGKHFYNRVSSLTQIKLPKYDSKIQVAFFIEVKVHKSKTDYASCAFVIGIDFKDNPGLVFPL
jgi:hypothetical protein